MKKTIFIALVFIFFFIRLTYADTSIKAEVDKLKLTTEESLTYKVIVTSSERRLPEPNIPKFDGFAIVSQAKSSSVSLVKNTLKTVLVYVYILLPRAIGKIKIEPSTIKVKGKIYSTDAIEVEVIQGKREPRIKPKEKPYSPKGIQPESEQSKITL